MDWTLSKLSKFLCEDSDTILLVFHISSIQKKNYNFFVLNSSGHIRLLFGSYSTKEYLGFVKDYVPDGCSYTKFANEIAPTKKFMADYKDRFYRLKTDLAKSVEALITKVNDLDFTTPQTTHGGLDGFSLFLWIPNQEKEFRVWCSHYDEYYAPVTDLANSLLDIANVDSEYRFRLYKR